MFHVDVSVKMLYYSSFQKFVVEICIILIFCSGLYIQGFVYKVGVRVSQKPDVLAEF